MHYSELAQLHVCEILEGEVIHGEAGVRCGSRAARQVVQRPPLTRGRGGDHVLVRSSAPVVT
jgi:hypothetical protein